MYLPVIMILAITGLFFIIPSYGLSVDKSTYHSGDTITVTGKIIPDEEIQVIVLQILNPPKSDIVMADQFFPNNDGTFSKTYKSDGPKWNLDGFYTLRVFYGEWSETTFEFQQTLDNQPKVVPPNKSYNPQISEPKVPSWIKNNAKWWAEGMIKESDFVGGIQHMIKEKIINIPDLPEQASSTAKEKVPDWIKNNAGWWGDGLISEDEFVNGIKYLVENGIIKV